MRRHEEQWGQQAAAAARGGRLRAAAGRERRHAAARLRLTWQWRSLSVGWPGSGGGGCDGGGGGGSCGDAADRGARADGGDGIGGGLIVTAGADQRACALEPRMGFTLVHAFGEHRDFIYSTAVIIPAQRATTRAPLSAARRRRVDCGRGG